MILYTRTLYTIHVRTAEGSEERMIDWNGDGRVDPTEVVLTNLILSEQPAPALEAADAPGDQKEASWLARLFQKRGKGIS